MALKSRIDRVINWLVFFVVTLFQHDCRLGPLKLRDGGSGKPGR